MDDVIDDVGHLLQPFGRRFKFMLSPSPEYRSAMMWEDTREVIAIRWDDTVDRWIQPAESDE